MSTILKTPEERFKNLKDYPFNPNYIELESNLNMHYVDEGKKDHPIVLLLHGEPSWSYLYRYMIPILSNKFRVIAPDLIGFGKSDKFTERSAYSYQSHMKWMTQFIEQLDLKNMLLFCQDWGGLLGLRLVAQMSDRFSMVVASNTTLPTGHVEMPEAFKIWREFSQKSESFDIARVIDSGTVQKLTEDAYTAYNAPFPTEEYKAGARVFPALVPFEYDDPECATNREAWSTLQKWNKPFLTVFGSHDAIMKGAEKAFQKLIPGTKNQDHQILHAGHFIQEEKGPELAQMIIDFYNKNS